MSNRQRPKQTAPAPLRVGFVPLCDCAPLVMAHELGLFAQHGLRVVLSRELGWATVRDKILYGELDAAHAPAGMVFAATLGQGSARVPCLTGLVLNLQGNAITLSNRLWEAGVQDGAGLRDWLRATCGKARPTFGVVFRYSSHDALLRQWLRQHRIEPERDVRIVVVPPPQMPANLRAGNLDGFCVGEPWNSVAIEQRAGWVVATSPAIAPLHPEKVLMVRSQFAESRPEEHRRLIAALLEACKFCDQAQNREGLVSTLAQRQYVNTLPSALRPSLCGPFALGTGQVQTLPEFHLFARHQANEPTPARARWVLEQLRASGALPPGMLSRADLGSACFRPDLFREALTLLKPPITPNPELSETCV